MRINNWQLCSKNPPPEYTRVEIKDTKSRKYIGYRCNQKYYETFGNYIIPDPFKWRYIPQGSFLWEEIKRKIRVSGNMEVAYSDNME